MNERRYIYRGEPFNDISISPVTYRPEYFDLEIALESDVYCEIRKRNDILPHRLDDSSDAELKLIREFFDRNRSSFFFLFDDNDLIGSILILRNFIQSLAVARKYQMKGYGEQLAKYAVNDVFSKGYRSVELKVLDGNIPALSLYAKLGFMTILQGR